MKAAVTIGNFDGVHRGHRSLIETVTEWKRSTLHPNEIKSVVITFEPHPIEVLRPGTIVPRLCSTREKVHLLQNLGVDEVQVLPFTKEFSKMPAREFFDRILIEQFDTAFIAVGHNFYFGHNREGTPGKIIDWSDERKIPAKLVPPIEADGDIVSSSRIRKLVQEGQMLPVSRLLGRDFSITGEVVHGDKRGRQLGFPTANVLPVTPGLALPCLPAKGVYLSSSTVDGRTFPSITNVGVKPTVSDKSPLVIETHVLDFDGDLYGKLLTVEFRDRLRPEQKFSGLEALKEQIQKDIIVARARLSLK